MVWAGHENPVWESGQEDFLAGQVVLGKQHVRAACLMDKLEFKFFSVLVWVVVFTLNFARNNFCIWTNRNGQNIYHGRSADSSRTARNYPKLFCTYIWAHCKDGWRHKVPSILHLSSWSSFIFICQFTVVRVITENNNNLLRTAPLSLSLYSSGCKETHFHSLPFGQAEASIY